MATNPVFTRIDKQIKAGNYAGFDRPPTASRMGGGAGIQDSLNPGTSARRFSPALATVWELSPDSASSFGKLTPHGRRLTGTLCGRDLSMMSAQPLKKRNSSSRSGEPPSWARDSSIPTWRFEVAPVVADTPAPYRLSTVRCSMYSSNSFIEYITMPPTFVTGGPPPVPLLRQP